MFHYVSNKEKKLMNFTSIYKTIIAYGFIYFQILTFNFTYV